VISNLIATQKVHEIYGGVVPELASRAHQQNIVPVVSEALTAANVSIDQIDVIAVTQGPGLMGSLLVGLSFAKSLSMARNIPLVGVNHMQAHVLAHFAIDANQTVSPEFPFLCLTVSGGHTQLVLVTSPLEMKVIGHTIDDAAGEAFDKAAKVLGLDYPGGPQVDKWAQQGNASAFQFTRPSTPGLSYSFSGLKTNLLYFLKEKMKADPEFIKNNMADICASYQKAVVDYLLSKLEVAAKENGVSHLALAGGVSANSELRKKFAELCTRNQWHAHIPSFAYCTDNAAMIGVAGYYLFEAGVRTGFDAAPLARMPL
jgi:N6-L-threonylcarbamoyladenine synthase